MGIEVIGLISILALVIIIMLGMPVGYTLIFVAIVGYAYVVSPGAAFAKLGTDFYINSANYALGVIPMFILMGTLLSEAGFGHEIFKIFNRYFGRIRGGLAVATVVSCGAFAAVCGSVIATAAAVIKIAVPEMEKFNYKKSFALGCTAAGSTLGVLIPPSGTLVIYGIITEESIGKLLIAGIIPGIMTALILAISCIIQVRINPMLAPEATSTTDDKSGSILKIWPIPSIFIIVIGGIYLGIFTPTEGGAVGAFMSLIFCVLTKGYKWTTFLNSLYNTVQVFAMTMMIIIGGKIFGHLLARTELPMRISESMTTLDLAPVLILSIVFFIYFIAGFFMEEFATLVIFTPLFYPLIINLGYSGIWYGVVTVLMLNIGLLTPPVGVVSLVASSLSDTPVDEVFKGVTPFWISMIVATFILIIFPEIVTFLPNLM